MRNVAVAALLVAEVAAWAQGPEKRRLAVFDFDNAAASGGPQIPFLQTSAPNRGKAVADLLVTRLVQNAVVSVIERSALDKLIAEQNLGNSDRTDALTAAKLGRVLGVDAIVLGSITHFDYDDRTTGGGGAGFGGFGHSSMSTKHDLKALVEISARVVSPDTAEVLSAAQGVGEIARKGVKMDVRDQSRTNVMMGGSNPLMNEAMDKAVAQLAGQIEQNVSKLPPRMPSIDGLVADAGESGRLVLNVGARSGVKPGDRLQVWRSGKEIRDPATGKVLLRDDTLLGEAVVASVTDVASIATYSGSEKVKTGDLVKSIPKK